MLGALCSVLEMLQSYKLATISGLTTVLGGLGTGSPYWP